MKLVKNSLIFIIAAATALVSCKQDDTLQYNNFTMGNVIDGTFISDQGNIFNVVEKNCSGDLEQMDRALVLCDVLKKVEGTENQYDVRLNLLNKVLDKAHVTKAAADADEEMSVQDPIYIDAKWISGGYINFLLLFETQTGSTQKHLINLVLDEEASSAGKYVFNLRHNSFGESLNIDNNELGGGYVSFPIAELIKEDSAEITVNWKWYKGAGHGWSSDIQDYSFKIAYTKGGFEQAPTTSTDKLTTKLN